MQEEQLTQIALIFGGLCFIMLVLAIMIPTSREKAGKRAYLSIKLSEKNSVSATRVFDRKNSRSRNVRDRLKQLEKRAEKKSSARAATLDQRLEMANLNVSPSMFYVFSLILGLFFSFIALILQQNFYIIAAVFITAGLGVPRWLLGYITQRRQKKFITDFPGAIDVVIRGLKSGLPISECLKVIARDVQGPVGEEFYQFTEGMRLGLSLEQAVEKMYERIPLQEVSFFGIVLAVQRKTGGNLAEALSNLSRVIRGRKTMEGKISALSMEAKASAVILGALPIVLGIAFNFIAPGHLDPLFTTTSGHWVLAGAGVWMLIGILIMKKMCIIKV